ncbi:MAG: hypothetical protein GY816_19700 [Cytophagales bacterium]|nr:hypothetical protein [Cytophagales bacterium]
MRQLLQAAVVHELRIIEIGIEKTKRYLQKFERQFNMQSDQFYHDFQAGKFDDRMDYIKWAGEYETLHQLRQDYTDLSETQLC